MIGKMAGHRDTDAYDHAVPAPFAIGPVALVAAGAALLALLRADRYGYFGDELYFVAAGRHPAFGYADQGPLIPALARVAAAPGSLVLLRVPAILAAVAGSFLAAATAREFGGRPAAQSLAALAYITCPYAITQAATLSTFAVDSALTAAAIWLLACWIRLRRDRILVAAALLVAVDAQVKLLAATVIAGLAAGALLCGPRELWRRAALWAGAGVALLAATPELWWQQRHGWPQLAMGAVIRTEQHAATGGAAGLPLQWALLTGVLGGPLALAGLWALFRRTALRPYRFIAIAAAVQMLFVIASGGRPYYAAGFFPAVFAAGAVSLPSPRPRATAPTPLRHRAERVAACVVGAVSHPRALRAAVLTAGAISVAIAVTVVWVLPLPDSRLPGPSRTQAELSTRMRMFGTTGWPRLIGTVEAAYRALAPAERAHSIIVTQTYWQAAALDVLGPAGLPPVYSPDRGFAYLAEPNETAGVVLYVSTEPGPGAIFTDAEPIAHLNDPLGFPGIDRSVTLWRCEHPRLPWATLWPRLTTLVLDPGLR